MYKGTTRSQSRSNALSAMPKDHDRAGVSFGLASTKNSTIRQATGLTTLEWRG